MNARELITNAWYLSGIVSRDLETVSGDQISDGLNILNELLGEKSGTGRYIPYYTQAQVATVAGQQDYTVPNLIVLDTLTFNIADVRYNMRRDSRYRFWGTARLDNIESLPFHYYSERVLGGSKISLYFLPNADIDYLTVTGRYALTTVALDDEMSTLLDSFYVSYLKYLLAQRLCDWYSTEFSPSKQKVLAELEANCVDVNPMDFTVKKLSTLSSRDSINYAQVNIGKGWRP